MIAVFFLIIGISTPYSLVQFSLSSFWYKFFTLVHLFDYDKKGENSKYFNAGVAGGIHQKQEQALIKCSLKL